MSWLVGIFYFRIRKLRQETRSGGELEHGAAYVPRGEGEKDQATGDSVRPLGVRTIEDLDWMAWL